MSDTVVSFIRTIVPTAVGALLAWLATKFGIIVPEEAGQGLVLFLTFAVSGLYYALVRELERRWPWVGALLGVAKAPSYDRLPASGRGA